jgi:proteasome assembly chaperone (PAC2) family protein
MEALTVHSMPEGLRRPVMIMAFTGWNDAAESATTAARYLATSFQAEKFAEIDAEEFYHFGLTRPLKWKAYCASVLELARRCGVTLVLTLGALLAEVPHTRPVRLSGTASDPELRALLGARATRYEGPTGIVGVLNTISRDQHLETASLWANVPHYISGIENPKATLALVKRVLTLLSVSTDLSDLDEAVKQFDQNLTEIVAQNSKIAGYVAKLERAASDEEEEPQSGSGSDLPPASELVAEIEQFLRRQRPE